MNYRVTAVFKGLYKVDVRGEQKLFSITGNMKKNNEFPVVGDLVYLNETEEIITSIEPRKTKLSRKVAGTEIIEQILVSNIDYVFIVSSLNHDFNIARLERYLTFVYESGANPIFVLTKADIGEDIEEKISELESISFGVPIYKVSVNEPESLEPLKKYFEKETLVTLVGSSGVGKSTLINSLLGHEVLETQGIREDDAKGRHTTTHRELFYLGKGGIIDTPGMRELQFWGGDLGNSFEDVEDLIAKCKFSDCTHTNEPKCAIRNAIEIGELSKERFERYKKLQKELIFIESKQNAGLKRAEKEKIINMMGSLDARKNIKNNKWVK
jgi:ribosome biogenesis GTPase